jgi:hypothetical protein
MHRFEKRKIKPNTVAVGCDQWRNERMRAHLADPAETARRVSGART